MILKTAAFQNPSRALLTPSTYRHDWFTQDPAKAKQRELGVLDDFVDWLWSRIVLDLSSIPVVETDDKINCPMVSYFLYTMRN